MNLERHPPPVGPASRVIAHVDMDAFFVAVERRDNPALAGKPVIVGGSVGNRGVVSAASYEARRFGVHSAMPMIQARRLCPGAVYIPASHSKYAAASRQVMGLLRTFSPALQVMSVDEAYLDLTGTERLHGLAFAAAVQIRAAIMDELEFSASVGIASNRLMAKVASELSKPAGILHIYPGQEAAILAPLSPGALPGVGMVTAARLRGMGIRTIGDIARLPLSVLEANFKSWGTELYRKARGEYGSDLVLDSAPKSVGKETTFGEDEGDPNRLEAVLSRLAGEAASRLRRKKLEARSVTLKIRFEDFATNTLAAPLNPATAIARPIFEAARGLLRRALDEKSGGRKIRLVGVYLGGLESPGIQPRLIDEESRRREVRLTETVDSLRERFGEDALVSGTSLEHMKRPETGGGQTEEIPF
ncbi:MAG TPA: DNA polymerase IV [Nitrospinae bacterium]|nr:DNA polymerase IV [Nitrospinota bacterium]